MRVHLAAHGGILKELLLTKRELTVVKDKLPFLPTLTLTQRQLCDVELLVNGAFSPLEGFLNEEDYTDVLTRMRLKDGTLWPIPLYLDVEDVRQFKVGSEIILCDMFGRFIAILAVSSIYRPDKKKEAKHIYGTLNIEHPGVNYLFNSVKKYYLGGKVYGLSSVERPDFARFRHTPRELQIWFKEHSWRTIIGFQTRNPIHKVHYEIIKRAVNEYKGKVLIHPAVGETKGGDIDYITRIRSYIAFHNTYAKNFLKLSLLPLAMRMAGPKEALWHAIIRKNYGCTHFIVGKDHAGPGKDSRGRPFYGLYDAQILAGAYAHEIGIDIIPFKEMVYVREKRGYLFKDETDNTHTIKEIAGTELRKLLSEGRKVPLWYSFPEVTEELKKAVLRQKKEGITVFFTGLPCAGKSTLATLLYFKLLELQDKTVTLLDGDIIRRNLSKGLGFSKEDRDENIRRIGFVASEITKHGGIAICAAVAPYKQAREENRKLTSQYGTYIEVYVSTPLRVCKKRDVKGLYKKRQLGVMKGLTGMDDPYERPKNAEIVLDTTRLSPDACVSRILSYLRKRELIHP